MHLRMVYLLVALGLLVGLGPTPASALYQDVGVSTAQYVTMTTMPEPVPGFYPYDDIHENGEELAIVWTRSTSRAEKLKPLRLGYGTPIQLCMIEPPGDSCGYNYKPSPTCIAHSPDCICYNWRFAGASNISTVTWRRHETAPGCVVVMPAPPDTSQSINYTTSVDLYWDLEGTPRVPPPGLVTLIELSDVAVSGGRLPATALPDIDQTLLDQLCPVRTPLLDTSGCYMKHTISFRYIEVSEEYIDRLIQHKDQHSQASYAIALLSAAASLCVLLGGLVLASPGTLEHLTQSPDSGQDKSPASATVPEPDKAKDAVLLEKYNPPARHLTDGLRTRHPQRHKRSTK